MKTDSLSRVSVKRAYNFSAGPAMLPEPVMQKVADEFLSYNHLGYSIAETSHRSEVFLEVLADTKRRLKALLNLDNSYHIIFLHGGATSDFYRIPLNFLYKKDHCADYILTGHWSTKAYNAARTIHPVHIAASSEHNQFSSIPEPATLNLNPNSRYLYLCSNNTLFGTQFQTYPKTENIPLIGDFTSDIFSRDIDYNQFSMIFAATQKNLAPPGCSVIAIKDDFLAKCNPQAIALYSYKEAVAKDSLFNTPPTFNIYFVNEVLKWIEAEGGVTVIEKRNRTKAQLLYTCLDNSDLYKPVAHKAYRSIMNVTWKLPTAELTQKFIESAANNNIVAIKGHRSTGGIRVSIYNAMKIEYVSKLVEFMVDFEKKH
ncbi:phosphoserine aminotransferase [Spirochaetota bacterium]|nr:phosphoserine aminotransferase [Spirochaetota bacterium]